MKNIHIYLSLILLVTSCAKTDFRDEYMGEEMMIDYMFNNFEYGAGLRMIAQAGEYQAATPNSSVWTATFEPHAETTDLVSKVDLLLSMNGGSESLHQSWSLADMYDGEFGLPRFDVSVSLPQALQTMGIAKFSGNDVVTFRFVMTLTDGRTFSNSNATGSMTGFYWSSPYRYAVIIGCKVPAGAVPPAGTYTLNGQDSWGDGWNGATVTYTIDGVDNVFGFSSGTSASTTFTLDGTQTLTISFSGGAWDSEVTYQLEFVDVNGENAQTALSDGTSPSDGAKDLNVCF
mgnify:FL=1|tara:strand:- start:5369 stop:6232 length:864 start_codon:yes stop_codon:yes gene_type:complete